MVHKGAGADGDADDRVLRTSVWESVCVCVCVCVFGLVGRRKMRSRNIIYLGGQEQGGERGREGMGGVTEGGVKEREKGRRREGRKMKEQR